MRRLLILSAGLVLGLAAGFLILLGFRADQSASEALPAGSEAQLAVGAPAPEFHLENLSGEQVSLADFRGQVVLLNFWATWCAPCRMEMPYFQVRADQNPDDLTVIAINFDEDVEQVQAFVDEMSLSFPVLLDPGGTVNRQYRVRGYPSSYLIDSQGVLQIQHIGLMTASQLDDYLLQLGLEQ